MMGVLLPPWACWWLIQFPGFRQVLEQAYRENVYLYQLLESVRSIGLEWRVLDSPQSEFMSADDAATHVGMTGAGIRKAARQGRIVGVKVGDRGDWQFSREAVQDFAEKR